MEYSALRTGNFDGVGRGKFSLGLRNAFCIASVFVCLFLAVRQAPAGTAAEASATAAKPAYRLRPEYDRTLARVVLSSSIKTRDLASHMDIVRLLPLYSEVTMLVPMEDAGYITGALREAGLGSRVDLVTFPTREVRDADVFVLNPESLHMKHKRPGSVTLPKGSIWAQDLFEVAYDHMGNTMILKPRVYRWFARDAGQDDEGQLSDNAFLGQIREAGVRVSSLPLAFKGGNILVDEIDGRTVAFCGSDVLRETAALRGKLSGSTPSPDEVTAALKEHLGVDEVVVMGGTGRQPGKLFHLDQAMVLLPGRVAAVTRIYSATGEGLDSPDVREARDFLDELRSTISSMGYRVVDILASVEDVLNYRYYVNGVPYLNSATGQREFLMPVFRGSGDGVNSDIFRGNVRTLESLGYRVIAVPTTANDHHGGIHCMMNALM